MEVSAQKTTSLITMCIKFKNSAFTLVELIIVMTIIVAMITVAAPYAKNSNKGRIVLNEVLNMQELIYYAIEKSKNSNKALRLVHSKVDRSYWLESSKLQDKYEFKKMDNSLGTAHNYDIAIQNFIFEGNESTKSFDYITFDPREQQQSKITIQLETLDCWAKLIIEKNNIEISNGSYK